MTAKSRELAERLKAFGDELLAFVEGCTPEVWSRRLAWEEWSVGVAARHVAAGHFEAIDLVRMIVQGKPLPAFTLEQLTQMANDHARKHAGCTREEVAAILRRNAGAAADYVAGLSDEELSRTGHLALAGGEITAENLVKAVILQSGGEHLANMRAAAAAKRP
jgi:hypothetical protein